jgi:aldehyde:ferredoxin oxidoreductase
LVWNRKIAYINLTTRKVVQKPIPKEMRTLYLGGRGINMYLLYNHVQPKTDPLSPDNMLLISAGLLGGIPCLGSGRCDIAAKSPLTGAVGDSNIGGFFGLERRRNPFTFALTTAKSLLKTLRIYGARTRLKLRPLLETTLATKTLKA